MTNFFKIVLTFILGISIVSCSKSGDDTEPLRDYDVQYATDLANIEAFMHNHTMTVTNNPGGDDDLDVTFDLISTSNPGPSIWDQTTYPIETRMVKVRQGDVDRTYKIYFIKLREGSGESPCNVDKVLTAYKGEYIYDSVDDDTSVHTIVSKEFETLTNPQTFFSLTGVIRGWSEIFPQFKTGGYASNPDGTVSYNGFGGGIMFIPSGLGYYGSAQSGIPAYSPLVFNVKLYEIERVDHDGDGIYSYQEDLNHDGYVYALPTDEGIVNPDNTNGPGSKVLISTNPDKYSEEDEVPDFLDNDDDGDFYTTKSETSFIHPDDLMQIIRYYPYNGAAVDDPATPYVDESKGVPNCSNDFTSPTRLRKYLDPTCH